MTRVFLLLVAGCWSIHDPDFTYEFRVRGAVTVTAQGRVEAGGSGSPEEPYYTITLGGPDGAAAAVFTRAGSAPPPVGAYRIGESELGNDGFSGLIIAGMPAHPTGVFRVRSGALTITASAPEQITGRFELHAVGFLTESPADDARSVTATGTFTARAISGADRSLTVPYPLTGGSDS